MIIHLIQHVHFETPGSIEKWADINGHNLKIIKVYENHSFPEVNEVKCLISMGGPMSANDDKKHPWIQNEIKLIQHSIAKKNPFLGICLGSQLLAKALQTDVRKNFTHEIGVFDIHKTFDAYKTSFDFLPDQWEAFHWHGETYELPDGYKNIYSSKACKNQFMVNGKILGIQFHPEITAELLQSMVENDQTELNNRLYVQSKEDILKWHNFKLQEKLCFQILDYLVS
jgi:GMP synthase-like glutamine amidotransferase